MIAYFDTSAFVPLLIDEPTSSVCRQVWSSSSTVVGTVLLMVEASAAIAQVNRLGRMNKREHTEATVSLEAIWSELTVIGIEEPMARRASELARTHSLRGYDTMHCAAAERLSGDDFVAVSGDHQLLAAWRALGVATVDTSSV